MKKIVLVSLCVGLLSPVAFAQTNADKPAKPAVVSATKKEFQTRRKQIKELIKKYKKAAENEKAAIKQELNQLVSAQVDAQIEYMKAYIADERANLDNWEKKIEQDEQHLEQVKAQRVEDLLSGAAKKKQKAAKKAWKKQMRQVKK